MAAYFLQQRGGRMSLLKLMKLLYLADRESMASYGHMMSGDYPVSMPQGSVLSQTYDLMNGATEPQPGGWDAWICDRQRYEVALNEHKQRIERDDLDELSEADLQVLETVWEEFGSMSRWAIRDWIHDYCPEWQDPEGSSNPIPLERIFAAVGYEEHDAAALGQEAEADRQLDRMFAAF